jgi:TetR/AcrR family transcriptional repressor of nem operon
MRVSRSQADENRHNVIVEAARLFRECGFDGVGLTQIMAAVGLTQGGFYKQFDSKEDLAVKACEEALCTGVEDLEQVVDRNPQAPFASAVGHYLSPHHRDCPGQGCTFSALGADAFRHGGQLLQTFERGLQSHLALIGRAIQASPEQPAQRDPMVAFSTMVGALLLSRVVEDDSLSRQILNSAIRSLLTSGETPADSTAVVGTPN